MLSRRLEISAYRPEFASEWAFGVMLVRFGLHFLSILSAFFDLEEQVERKAFHLSRLNAVIGGRL